MKMIKHAGWEIREFFPLRSSFSFSLLKEKRIEEGHSKEEGKIKLIKVCVTPKMAKIAIIGISAFLLVAAFVGTVTYSVSRSSTSEGDSIHAPMTSMKSADTMCQPTDYKETCLKSLSGAQNTSDPKELMKVAFQATVDSIGEVLQKSSLLQEAAKDNRTSQALENCKSHLQNSIDDIKRSFDQIGTFDLSKFNEYTIKLKTWLSAAITYQETCLDEFEGTEGDTGSKMRDLLRNTTELSSNGLAMVSELSKILTSLQIPGLSRKLLSTEGTRAHYLEFLDATARRLLQANSSTPNAVVAKDGSGQFKTITEAIRSVPVKSKQTYVILVKAGVYNEYVVVPKNVTNLILIGEGPLKTKITGNKNFIDGTGTYHTATVAVNGEGFVAKNIGFENSAGAAKHQAVALRVSADMAVFYNCQIDGYQDTLYAHSGRQFYRECTITGTIDFIFGDAASVFQNCKMIVREPLANQDCMVTAQGRTERHGIGGIVIQNSEITADAKFYAMKPARKAFLGRPWKQFSRTIIMQSYIDKAIAPEGWSVWNQSDHGLHTSYYAEYLNKGPGASTSARVTWQGIKQLTANDAESFTLGPYMNGEPWVKNASVPYFLGMVQA